MSPVKQEKTMYLWVVLTTFLAMIAAYYLPIRNDTSDKQDVGVARAQLVQMVAKHKAVMQYMLENMYPYYCADGLDCENDQSARGVVNFTGGYTVDATIAPYFPKGFYNNPNYISRIYCMTRNEATGEYLNKGSDCNSNTDTAEATTVRAAITYGAIPERLRVYSQKGERTVVSPSADLISAMREQFSSNEIAGYAYYNEHDELVVVNFEKTISELPAPMVNIAEGDGVAGCLNEYGTCLVYMSWR